MKKNPKITKTKFPIVGIGASAGGLEALEQFFRNVPASSGLGFVVVQHLDPTHPDLLVELLQRVTKLPVSQIKDRTLVEPNHIYVIQPNRDISLLNDVLHLLEPKKPRGLRLPIDFFFRSLALDRKETSVGVILSGMGSDGTLGLKAIKEVAGAVFVQTPASARFDSMPRMAIESGSADIIATAEELPAKIVEYLKHRPLLAGAELPKDEGSLDKVIVLLRSQTGHDFSLYKKSTIYRRVERRMGLHRLTKLSDYVRYLQENTQESELLFKELLIGVTSFFRDSATWDQFRDEIIPAMAKKRPLGAILRAWTVGCSTGEEAYSLAMVFAEAMDTLKLERRPTIQIFATDLDKDAIDIARAGNYPANIISDVSEKRLEQFFVKDDNGNYTLSKRIREMIVFAPQNVVMDPPFTKLDFVVCRNLLIYFDAELQKRLIPLFHYSLTSGGYLLLGSAESIGTATMLFQSLPGKNRFYQRLATVGTPILELPSVLNGSRFNPAPANNSKPDAPARSLQALADQLVLQTHAPAAVLATREGDILYVNGKTGKYLEPAAGKANWNIFAMARDGLANSLSEGFNRVNRTNEVVTQKNISVDTNGGTQIIDLTVRPISSPEELRGMILVVFQDVTPNIDSVSGKTKKSTTVQDSRIKAIEQELKQAHLDLQATRDEVQISQEELRSTIEELQSMNEELTTSKEETQSINEELQTVNHELQAKVDQLSRTSNDMKNLLNSTNIAILFLDEALLIRRFTNQTVGIFKLIPGDVGRPITDIVTTLNYPEIKQDAREVLKTLVSLERQVMAQDDRWFTVRVIPYSTQENRVAGVVVTFTDITSSKNLEAALRKAQMESDKKFLEQKAEAEQKT